MKTVSSLLFICLAFACTQPLHVTTKVDNQAATSGTLGSAKFENNVRNPVDSSVRKTDTLKIKKNN